MSRTGGDLRARREGRERPLDLGNDRESHRQRLATVFTGDNHRSLASHRIQKALELQSEWLAIRRDEWHPLDERFDRLRPFRQLGEIDIASQAKELSFARREIERQIPTLLEDPYFPHALPRYAARRDVCHGAVLEAKARIGNVDERRQDLHTDRRDILDVPADQCADEIDVVDHQIQNDGDVSTPWIVSSRLSSRSNDRTPSSCATADARSGRDSKKPTSRAPGTSRRMRT